jgi:hypothetical protein
VYPIANVFCGPHWSGRREIAESFALHIAQCALTFRWITLGNPRLHVARKSAVHAVKSEADRYAANVLPIIREAQKAGARTLREIA